MAIDIAALSTGGKLEDSGLKVRNLEAKLKHTKMNVKKATDNFDAMVAEVAKAKRALEAAMKKQQLSFDSALHLDGKQEGPGVRVPAGCQPQ